MWRAAAVVLVVALAGPAWAKGGGGHAPRAPREPAAGSKHEEPHGGTYQGGSGGSSHKGGKYKDPETEDRYRKHKP